MFEQVKAQSNKYCIYLVNYTIELETLEDITLLAPKAKKTISDLRSLLPWMQKIV
jgi:hypothetical protein